MRLADRLFLSLIAAAAAIPLTAAENWPNFRGPNHDGVSRETGLRTAWTTPVPLLWDREVGAAFSGLTLVDGRVYTCGTIDRKQTLLCLDAESGAILWQMPFEEEYVERQGGDGARATPTFDDGHVYVMGALGTVLCVKASDGSEVWRRKYDAVPQWGYSGSILIEGDLAVFTPGRGAGGLAALNKKTGEPVWKVGDDMPAYGTPVPFEFGGKRYIVCFTAQRAVVVESPSGREVLSIPWKTDWDVNAAAPIYHEGHLFLSTGYKTGSALFKLTAGGDRLNADKVWENRVIMNKFQSSVLYDGYLYTSDQNGLRCVNFMTGKPAWQKRRIDDDGRTVKDSTLILAQGHIFLVTESGELVIAPATPDDFKPVTRAKILGGLSWTLPTIYNGRLYTRDLTRLVCFNLREQS